MILASSIDQFVASLGEGRNIVALIICGVIIFLAYLFSKQANRGK